MPLYAAASDGNQQQIIDGLRSIGATVESLHRVGRGCPDLMIGFRGYNLLMEVKTVKGKMRESQVVWHGEWRGQVATVRSVEDALAVIEAVTT